MRFFRIFTPVAGTALLLGLVPAAASADQMKGNSMTSMPAFEPADEIIRHSMPAGYREAARRSVEVDGETAELVRYTREDERNARLGGEHFSAVISKSGRLKGFTRMDLDLLGGDLPGRDEAQEIAMAFLARAAPDLLPGLEISWIAHHEEALQITHNGDTEARIVTGMKVKMRNRADGRWMWVIVGADRRVMVFERDIEWISFPGHRGTEKWLHDSWLIERGETAWAS